MNHPEVIDFHAHIYPQKIAEKASRGVGEFYNIPMGHIGTAERLMQSGDAAGVSRFVVQSVATTPRQVRSINAFIKEECDKSGGRLIGLGAIHPDVEDPIAEIENIERLGLHGVKIHPDVQKFMLDDPKMFPIYQRLEGRLPILIHCGDYRYPYSHPERLARVLDRFPKLDVVAAHFGGWNIMPQSLAHPQPESVLYDTSSTLGMTDRDIVLRLIDKIGPDRLIFGTDFPMWSPKEELARFLALDLDESSRQKILYENFMKLLKLHDEDEESTKRGDAHVSDRH